MPYSLTTTLSNKTGTLLDPHPLVCPECYSTLNDEFSWLLLVHYIRSEISEELLTRRYLIPTEIDPCYSFLPVAVLYTIP